MLHLTALITPSSRGLHPQPVRQTAAYMSRTPNVCEIGIRRRKIEQRDNESPAQIGGFAIYRHADGKDVVGSRRMELGLADVLCEVRQCDSALWHRLIDGAPVT